MSDTMDERRRALEESFFNKQNQELVARLQAEKAQAEAKVQLAETTGIEDEELLDELVAVGVTAASLAALRLYPLVAVGWADRTMEPAEKKAILLAAGKQGIEEGSDGYKLVAGWLERQPEPFLFDVWKDYVQELKTRMPAGQFAALKNAIMALCNDVAASAGGLLGIGAVSSAEKTRIAEFEAAFDG